MNFPSSRINVIVSQLESLMSIIRPHMAYAARSPSEKEEFVEVIKLALSSQPDIIVRARLLQSTSDTGSTCSIEDITDSMDADELKGSKFRQAFSKAILKMMGSRSDKNTRTRGRRQSRKRQWLRGRTQSHDGYISSDYDGAASKYGSDDSGDLPTPRTVFRHSSLLQLPSRPPPLNITVEEHDYHDATHSKEDEYTTSLNDSAGGPSRGARPIRNSSHSRGGGMNDSSHSSMSNDSSTDNRLDNLSKDGYASSDDDNFMNDVAHKSLPGHGYAISDDGSVDSFG
jgi:hypothetical protein